MKWLLIFTTTIIGCSPAVQPSSNEFLQGSWSGIIYDNGKYFDYCEIHFDNERMIAWCGNMGFLEARYYEVDGDTIRTFHYQDSIRSIRMESGVFGYEVLNNSRLRLNTDTFKQFDLNIPEHMELEKYFETNPQYANEFRLRQRALLQELGLLNQGRTDTETQIEDIQEEMIPLLRADSNSVR
ncbi:MAG: hypothetical protein KDD36_08175 [Flavobacteriales bacterium]|nr:hypothetical protein [Flavobacteriales bacterium]